MPRWPTSTPSQRFWSKVSKTASCWLWVGGKCRDGYGSFAIVAKGDEPRRSFSAHRFAYEELSGQIPDGMTLDHLCRNRACVNPAHMDPVPLPVNIMRGFGVGAKNAAKVTCYLGHQFDRTDSKGRRECSVCAKRRGRNSTARYRAKTGAP